MAFATLPACAKEKHPAAESSAATDTLYAFEEPHMGTLFRIKLYAASEETARLAATAAFDRVGELNGILSDYVPDSELNRLTFAEPGTPVAISGDLYEVLKTGLALAEATGGAFDPTIGHYTNLWRRSVRKGVLPDAAQLDDVRAKTGYRKVKLTPAGPARPSPAITLEVANMKLDLGGIAKGYAADEALAVLVSHGVTRAAVAAGGDIRVGDPPPGEDGWEIPVLGMDRAEKQVDAVVRLKHAAVSTSGDREQFVEIDGVAYSHIVDPRTGLGLTQRITATVIAPRAVLTDSHATALCILGPEKGIAFTESLPGVEAMVITTDEDGKESRHATSGFLD